MTTVPMVIGKYVYIQDDLKGGSQAVDVHHILIQKRSSRNLLSYLTILPVLAYIMSLVLYKAWHGKSIKKESVVIMAGFGVQLETHYNRFFKSLSIKLSFPEK
ncbi:hypothetical protein AQUCO_01500331v1 [Aquilegia coerulea]|uniref:Uncharacterized protein n=1 Tax=Aquilegia coerulea TaxID=218851 RepID=A0A2G5DT89_AQUCA|nr:hypothetical protein AQUCO_01500331v1 [Aquilegia coerulea]